MHTIVQSLLLVILACLFCQMMAVLPKNNFRNAMNSEKNILKSNIIVSGFRTAHSEAVSLRDSDVFLGPEVRTEIPGPRTKVEKFLFVFVCNYYGMFFVSFLITGISLVLILVITIKEKYT